MFWPLGAMLWHVVMHTWLAIGFFVPCDCFFCVFCVSSSSFSSVFDLHFFVDRGEEKEENQPRFG